MLRLCAERANGCQSTVTPESYLCLRHSNELVGWLEWLGWGPLLRTEPS